MPYFVQELLDNKRDVITAKLDEPVHDALVRMLENDFSQLPVIDEKNKPLGMITFESLLQAQISFGVGLNDLKVEHALVKSETYPADADLFDLLNRLRDSYAALIVDREDILLDIVTSYDTTEYFRRRAEDMMLVQDVESTLKAYVLAAYAIENGAIDQEKLDQAVQKATNGSQAQQEKFKAALSHYLSMGENKTKPDLSLLEQVLSRHYGDKQKTKTFEDLAFSEYMAMLFDKGLWQRYQPIFKIELKALHNLLDKVRDTRNALAHFRDDLSTAQRKHLRVSSSWLGQYEDAIQAAFLSKTKEPPARAVNESKRPDSTVEIHNAEISIASDMVEVRPTESRYAALSIYLQNLPESEDVVKLTFAEIEGIIGTPLPQSAYKHRAWWANDSVSHAQSQEWLDAGWRVSTVSFPSQTISFSRIEERRKAYIDFFSALLNDLRKKPDFDIVNIAPRGRSWHNVESFTFEKKVQMVLVFSFGRGDIFRIEMYIDNGNQETNKRLFDRLFARKESIENAIGCRLEWERLDNRRASRISIIENQISVSSSEEKLEALRQKAVAGMVKFKSVMTPIVQEIAHREL